MPKKPEKETAEQRDARLVRQRAYEQRRRENDLDGFKRAQAESAKRYRENNSEKSKAAVKKWRNENREKFNSTRRAWRVKNIIRVLWLEAKSRAKARGIPFLIELEDIPPMGENCPIFGHAFSKPEEGRTPFSASIDRIDSSMGYEKGNVWIIGQRANLIKNDGTAEEHEKIASAMKLALIK
jgi:hypothetical protein